MHTSRIPVLHRPAVRGALYAVLTVATVLLLIQSWHNVQREPLPDFRAIEEVGARKQAFFAYLAPLVQAANDRLREQRARLQVLAARLDAGEQLAPGERRWLRRLASEYEIESAGHGALAGVVETLLRRVDTVPPALALVQAAIESGWGRSRFAREGNNLFGHWCYEPGCGLVPRARERGAGHEVARFRSAAESVARYLHNLNTHPAYLEFRLLRAELRRQGQRPSALLLADGLLEYSIRRERYVRQVKRALERNAELLRRSLAGAGAGA